MDGLRYAQRQPGTVGGAALSELHREVRRLLLHNLMEGYSPLLNQHYCYIAPSPGRYPFQWFWDSCFHVIMLSRLGELEIAKRALRSLFAMQEDDGFVGHMVFWRRMLPTRVSDILQARPSLRDLRPHMSALIQPPFVATALLRLFDACGDRVFLGELYARVRRYHEWLAAHRDLDGDGLITIITPFESGMDWKPSYDAVVGYERRVTSRRLYTSSLYWKVVRVDWLNFADRYHLGRIRKRGDFLVKDAGFNAIYALDLHAMEKLAGLIGDDAERFAARRRRVVESMLRLMYDPQEAAFYDVQEPGHRKLRTLTPTIFFPLAAPEVGDEIASHLLAAHWNRNNEFAAPLPLPSVATGDPSFYRGRTPYIWRGPMWALINWFLYHALKKRGFAEQADELRRALSAAVERSGFREYYDPLTGEGHGAESFTWSGLLIDMV
jgi:glycogen debranching enzyme